MLSRANLPIEILALSVCILDSLNSRFALSWRKGLPLKGHSLQRIDDINPELIALCSVIIAHKFLDDNLLWTEVYAHEWGKDIWSNEHINFTQRCILENLDYSIAPLWEEKVIKEAMEDMELAGRYWKGDFDVQMQEKLDWEEDTCSSNPTTQRTKPCLALEMNWGKATIGLGDQLTPAETPGREFDDGEISPKTKTAFRLSTGGLVDRKDLKLPSKGRVNEGTETSS
jgi:hypothetical protein